MSSTINGESGGWRDLPYCSGASGVRLRALILLAGADSWQTFHRDPRVKKRGLNENSK